MKKKILVAGLTFSLLAGAAIGFAACDDTHTHSLSSVEKKDATCTEAGYESYYKCSDCDKIFSDSKGETEISAPTAIPAAHKVTAVAQKDSTCTAEGTAAHYKCSECDTLFSDSEGKNVITSAGKLEKKAHTIEEVSKKRPSCTEAGYEAHYKCTDCETLFSDEEGKTVITEPTAIPAEHRIDEVPELKATCITAGYKAHYACSLCKELFADSEAKNKIEKPEEIPANGIHDYGFGYTSETAPVPEATGGKLQTKCIVCDKEGDEVAYEKGFSMKGKFRKILRHFGNGVNGIFLDKIQSQHSRNVQSIVYGSLFGREFGQRNERTLDSNKELSRRSYEPSVYVGLGNCGKCTGKR